MICPTCRGRGEYVDILNGVWVDCPDCNGTGEVQTEAEYIRSLLDEDLAIWIYHERCKYSDGWYEQCGHTVEEVKEWLKEKHE